jgi:hypothetical protein
MLFGRACSAASSCPRTSLSTALNCMYEALRASRTLSSSAYAALCAASFNSSVGSSVAHC